MIDCIHCDTVILSTFCMQAVGKKKNLKRETEANKAKINSQIHAYNVQNNVGHGHHGHAMSMPLNVICYAQNGKKVIHQYKQPQPQPQQFMHVHHPQPQHRGL